MLDAVGHPVAVLDGGIQSWTGATADGSPPSAEHGNLQPGTPLTRQVSADDLQRAHTCTLIDARAPERFSGAEEPIDPVAGHIPGAECVPFSNNLDNNGCFHSAAQLRQQFARYGDNVVAYCGSGVTATHNVLAMHIAGLPEPALYPGSWSEWITDPSRPVDPPR